MLYVVENQDASWTPNLVTKIVTSGSVRMWSQKKNHCKTVLWCLICAHRSNLWPEIHIVVVLQICSFGFSLPGGQDSVSVVPLHEIACHSLTDKKSGSFKVMLSSCNHDWISLEWILPTKSVISMCWRRFLQTPQGKGRAFYCVSLSHSGFWCLNSRSTSKQNLQ